MKRLYEYPSTAGLKQMAPRKPVLPGAIQLFGLGDSGCNFVVDRDQCLGDVVCQVACACNDCRQDRSQNQRVLKQVLTGFFTM
jgi:hypothetical protein